MSEHAESEKGVRAYQEGDYATALFEFRQLVEQGLTSAQNDLGVMYENGVGVSQGYQEASQWFHRAAAQGHASAQYALGMMHKKGEGVPQDAEATVRWWRCAAEQGHAFAQSNLGVMYAKGTGVAQDYVRAHMWFNIAASSGKVYAREIREDARKMRGDVEKNLSAAQIIEAEHRARECIEKHYKGYFSLCERLEAMNGE